MSLFLEDDAAEQTNAPSTEKAHTLWVEAYRPTKLEDYIGNDDLKTKVKKWIDTNDVPHLLFYGGPGTGKTSISKLIVKSIKCDVLYINASDENGIDTIRVKIKNFASTLGFSGLKVVICDESDGLSFEAQSGLRNMIEVFSKNTRFILTCNFHERMLDAIVSRCQSFPIYPPNKKDVAATLIKILTAEGVKFDKEGVITLVTTHYPDIRAVINTAQSSVIDGVLTISKEQSLQGDTKTKMVEMLKNPSGKSAFTEIRQLVADNTIRDFSDFYTYLYEKVDEYAPGNIGAAILILAESQAQASMAADKEIVFMAAIYRIIQLK